MKKTILSTLCLTVLVAGPLLGQSNPSGNKKDFISAINTPSHWVDSVFRKMTKDERIAQLFMVPVYSNHTRKQQDSIVKLVQQYGAGGIITFQGGPVRNALLINNVQKGLKVPAMVATDGEWGLAMRLDSTVAYPYAMTLGAIRNNELLYEMGSQMAKQFLRAGIQINFAPVVDVNNNIKNPVINFRSFGENKENVAAKGIAVMKGMQNGGMITSAKHFPGHGDTDVDSHYDLPKLNFSRTRLDTLEMYPFREMIKAGAAGVMVGHMDIPSLDDTPNMPSSLSRKVVTDLLKNELGFRGLIFTDAMNMKGVVKFHPKGEAAVAAMAAGNDVLEMVEDLNQSITAVHHAIKKHEIKKKEVYARTKKILAAKEWLGLTHHKEVSLTNLTNDLNPPEAADLITRLTDAAATQLIAPTVAPLRAGQTIAVISIGKAEQSVFQTELSQVKGTHLISIPKDASDDQLRAALATLQNFDQVILGIHDFRVRPRSVLDFKPSVIQFIGDVIATEKAYICILANAYTMAGLSNLEKSCGLWVFYEDTPSTERSAAKVMLGTLKPTGKLPVTVNQLFKEGM